MNRRNFFASSLNVVEEIAAPEPKSSASNRGTATKPVPQRPSSGIATYTGPWTEQQAAHVLRRTLFGPTHAEIKQAVKDGMATTIKNLLAQQSAALPPINFDEAADLAWYHRNNKNSFDSRANSLKAWWMDLMLFQPMNITEKLSLFWHNHLVTSINGVGDPRLSYEYLQLIRNNCMGNFKELMLSMSKNAAVLVYLHGNQNKVGSPNQDFARELMELFTLGRVDGNGNPNYSQQDVQEIARALTGWVTIPGNTGLPLQPFASFSSANHDIGLKQLSAHFGYATVQRQLPTDYQKEMDDVIEILFARKEVAENIVRELYRWFVYYDIDATVEQNVIQPLATLFRNNGYEIKPVMEKLLSSEHFYDVLVAGSLIKNPIDFTVGTLRSMMDTATKSKLALNPMARYDLALTLHEFSAKLQMELLNPPNVAGWKAYYQYPVFNEIWLNTVTLNLRNDFSEAYLRNQLKALLIRINGQHFLPQAAEFDSLLFFADVSDRDVTDLNKVIDSVVALLFPQPITANQRQKLLQTLTNGLPDSEFGKELLMARAGQNEAMKRQIASFMKLALEMAEYQLS